MNTYLILAIICAVGGIVFTYLITSYLSKRGVKINYWLLRYRMFSYLRQYRKLTIEEHGQTGSIFYAFIGSWILTVVFVVLGLIF